MNEFKSDIIKNSQPHKGPFWVTSDKTIALPVAPSVNPVPSHKEVWKSVKGKINAEWNYYPRGRIEILHGKAIVFLNSLCYEYAQLECDLRQLFSLDNMEIVWKTDNSAHYIPGMIEH